MVLIRASNRYEYAYVFTYWAWYRKWYREYEHDFLKTKGKKTKNFDKVGLIYEDYPCL